MYIGDYKILRTICKTKNSCLYAVENCSAAGSKDELPYVLKEMKLGESGTSTLEYEKKISQDIENSLEKSVAIPAMTVFEQDGKEYAVMQSIGMTTKQLIRLIVNEGLLYALSSTVLGIVLSALVDSTMVKIICNAIWFMTYKLLLWPAITLSVVTIILSGVIPAIVFKSFNKESIVEKIRKDF